MNVLPATTFERIAMPRRKKGAATAATKATNGTTDEDEFVMTLSSGDEAGGDGGSEEDSGASSASEVADEFDFDAATPHKGWDMATAKQHAATSSKYMTSVDEKVERRRERRRKAGNAVPTADTGSGDTTTTSTTSSTKKSGKPSKKHSEVDDDESSEDEVTAAAAAEAEAQAAYFDSAPGGDQDWATAAGSASFSALNLSRPLLKAVGELGWSRPTPIQAKTIPVALMGRDLVSSAVTGSGKTAAFMLPVLERLLYRDKSARAVRVLVLTPTRELAAQIFEMTTAMARFTDIRIALVVGGMSLANQAKELKSRPDVVVGTMGRLIDHARNTAAFGLDSIEVLILDEADKLLEECFEDEVNELVGMCPANRQTMLFSATMSAKVERLVELSLRNPVRLSADPIYNTADNLQQEFVRLKKGREGEREAVVLSLCERSFTTRTIVFAPTKAKAHRLLIIFRLVGLSAAELHGNLSQTSRLEALDGFRNGDFNFLIATDIAGRGIDVVGVDTVINYQMPKDLRSYIHRVGRTARAGRIGRAVTLATEGDRKLVKAIVKQSKRKVSHRIVPRESIEAWVERIEDLEDDISAIGEEEKEEKMLRIAEMEMRKAENMLLHSDEIASRPARTWFQTKADKLAAKEKHVASRKRKRDEGESDARYGSTAEDEQEAEAAREAAAARWKEAKRMRRAKARSGEMRDDERLQMEGVRAAKRAKSLMRKGIKMKVPKTDKQTPKKKKKPSAATPKRELTAAQKAAKRGGKGVKAFKSKSRYKRRK